MDIVAENTQTVEPSESDRQWWSDQNTEWDDLDGHPTIDDETIDDERRYWADEARRYAADPTDEEIADLDERAEEAEFMDAYERGVKLF